MVPMPRLFFFLSMTRIAYNPNPMLAVGLLMEGIVSDG